MFGWFRSLLSVSEEHARQLLRSDRAPRGLCVSGDLSLARTGWIRTLPRDLTARNIDVTACPNLLELPLGLRCENLVVRGTSINHLPPDLRVTDLLDASACEKLRDLPASFTARQVTLRGCTSLVRLPTSLTVERLDVSGCTRLQGISAQAGIYLTHLHAAGCTALSSLPETLLRLVELDVQDCPALRELPDGIQVRSFIDVAGSGLTYLPASLRSARLLWRGVPVSDRVAFDPDSIDVDEILNEPNQEVRRVLLERLGIEAFIERARPEIVDSDADSGGERRLLRVRFDGGEDVLCVSVRCPSTGKQYLLRVPPNVRTCHEAIAWTAGFLNPDEYSPVEET